jgi:hypothetical protein
VQFIVGEVYSVLFEWFGYIVGYHPEYYVNFDVPDFAIQKHSLYLTESEFGASQPKELHTVFLIVLASIFDELNWYLWIKSWGHDLYALFLEVYGLLLFKRTELEPGESLWQQTN